LHTRHACRSNLGRGNFDCSQTILFTNFALKFILLKLATKIREVYKALSPEEQEQREPIQDQLKALL
jgi:hypothetical protein